MILFALTAAALATAPAPGKDDAVCAATRFTLKKPAPAAPKVAAAAPVPIKAAPKPVKPKVKIGCTTGAAAKAAR